MKILDNKQINQKIRRLAYEILEDNYQVKKLIFLGINTNGTAFAQLLADKYNEISTFPVTVGTLSLNPADPLSNDIELQLDDVGNLNRKNIIVIADVANTGRTLYYAMRPIMAFLPKKIQVAVLVDRKHKSFPISVDYVGLSLATTLKENIEVDIKKVKTKSVTLE